jgi:glycosyltransferase involved in cell wall biosynthesis
LTEIDIFVHCPTIRAEGLSIVTIEAMALGKSVTVSGVTGILDYLQKAQG